MYLAGPGEENFEKILYDSWSEQSKTAKKDHQQDYPVWRAGIRRELLGAGNPCRAHECGLGADAIVPAMAVRSGR